ncbi:MAG: hypothetical protein R3E35_12340 [Rhodocyclaceae bacterium]
MVNRINKLFVLSAAVLIVTAITGCDAALSPEEKREKARAAAGMDASVTAVILVSAARSCQVVGVGDIDKCVQLNGTLIADQSAQMLASMAVDRRKDYWSKCQADFDQQYCNQLIQRAVAIELRKPRTSE